MLKRACRRRGRSEWIASVAHYYYWVSSGTHTHTHSHAHSLSHTHTHTHTHTQRTTGIKFHAENPSKRSVPNNLLFWVKPNSDWRQTASLFLRRIRGWARKSSCCCLEVWGKNDRLQQVLTWPLCTAEQRRKGSLLPIIPFLPLLIGLFLCPGNIALLFILPFQLVQSLLLLVLLLLLLGRHGSAWVLTAPGCAVLHAVSVLYRLRTYNFLDKGASLPILSFLSCLPEKGCMMCELFEGLHATWRLARNLKFHICNKTALTCLNLRSLWISCHAV